MRITRLITLLVAALGCGFSARAATIETVPIANPGNAGDVQPRGTLGSVAASYRIGRTEVTNAQYVEMLNGVDPTGANALALYSPDMSRDAYGGINLNSGAANGSKYAIKSGRDNNPVVFISWYDAIRFTNWLHNGQGAGDTESGAYKLLGGAPTPSNSGNIIRTAGARWWLPSENEWYKAAYHKNDGVTANYWDYPTSTDAVPFSDQPPGSDAPTQSNTANFLKNDGRANGYDDGYAVTGSTTFPRVSPYTDVGAYMFSTSPYGTLDQGGNVYEWNETLIDQVLRVINGGSCFRDPSFSLASVKSGAPPALENPEIGFRVASIPEPPTVYLGAFIAAGLLCLSRSENARRVCLPTRAAPPAATTRINLRNYLAKQASGGREPPVFMRKFKVQLFAATTRSDNAVRPRISK